MRGFFVSLFDVVLLLELFNTAATVDELLLTCEERMAFGANVQSDFRLCGLCHECVSASACNFAVYIFGMNSFFHFFLLLYAFVGSRAACKC